MKLPRLLQNLKFISIYKNRNNITLDNIYTKNKLQKNYLINIHNISIYLEDETEKEKENDHGIETTDKNIL